MPLYVALTDLGAVEVIRWNNDTVLRRVSAGVLKTDGEFQAAAALLANAGGATSLQLVGNALRAVGTDANQPINLRSKGSSAVVINGVAGDGTGGLQVWTGGATPAQRLSVSGGTPLTVYPAQGGNAMRVYREGETGIRAWITDMGVLGFGGATGTPDTVLYRSAADVLATDDAFTITRAYAGALLTLANTDAGGSGIISTLGAAGLYLLRSMITGDTQYRFQITAAGALTWGAGGGTAPDVTLYRAAADQLRTDDTLVVARATAAAICYITNTDAGGAGLALTMANAGRSALYTVIAGEGIARFSVAADGTHNWGPGNAATDTNLYRSAAGIVKTDGELHAVTALVAGAGAASSLQLRDNSLRAVGSDVNHNINLRAKGTGVVTINAFANDASGGLAVYGGGATAPVRATIGQATPLTVYPAAGNNAMRVLKETEAAFRFTITDVGTHTWSDGVGGADTNLYRAAADTLKTDDRFVAAGGLDAGGAVVSNVATPVAGTDAATRAFVESTAARGCPAVPAQSSVNGTAAGAGEVRDDVLGVYQFTALAGRRYVVHYTGGAVIDTAGGTWQCNVRMASGAAPTSASTMVASTYCPPPYANSYVPVNASAPFTPAAGDVRLAVFYTRPAGAGTLTPVNLRSLWVEDVGAAA